MTIINDTKHNPKYFLDLNPGDFFMGNGPNELFIKTRPTDGMNTIRIDDNGVMGLHSDNGKSIRQVRIKKIIVEEIQ